MFILPLFFVQESIVLTVKVEGLKNNKGKILYELRDANKNFIKGGAASIENNICVFSIRNLSPGKYSFKYFHDENENNKIDTNFIGIPKEGFGFSNNATGTFGPPSFQKTIFQVKNDTTVTCSPKYY